MKRYNGRLVLGLLFFTCNAPIYAMLNSSNTQEERAAAIDPSPHNREYPKDILHSLLTGIIVGSAIIGSALHIGSKIQTISNQIGQINFDTLNEATNVISEIDQDIFNQAIDKIAKGGLFVNRTLELIKQCPEARRHIATAIYNIDRDCFPLPYEQQAFVKLTIALE